MKKSLLSLVLLLLTMVASAHDFEVDGIYYNIISAEERTVEVTNYPYEGGPGYEGDIVIPEQITHDGKTYTITSIGQGVFGGTSKINSVYLPNTIKEINGLGVFIDCINLTSVHLSEIITKIPDLAADSYVTCLPGMFAIFFPQDGHAPCIAGVPEIKKAIFKVSVK